MTTQQLWQQVGGEVTRLMQAQQWTVRGLARKARVDSGTVQDFLDGKFGTVRAAEQICQAFDGLALSDVIASVVSKDKGLTSPNPIDHLILRKYHAADAAGQRLLREMLAYLLPATNSESTGK